MTDAIEKPKTKPLAAIAPTPLAEVDAPIESILRQIVDAGRPTSDLTEVLGVWERLQDRKAQAAFNAAFVQFKRDCPPIVKGTPTDQYKRVTADGRKVSGAYADIADITKVVDGELLKCELSYRFIDTKVVDGCMVTVCRLAHVGGHYEDTPSPPFPIGEPVRSRSGDPAQSVQQVSASVATYARRYALIAALGLVTLDPDDDGRGSQAAETVSTEQQRQIADLLSQWDHPTGEALLFDLMGVEKISEIPAARYDVCCKTLQGKIMAKAKT